MRSLRSFGVLLVGLLLAVIPMGATAFAAPPGAPTDVLAISGHGSARVAWFGPANNGGSPITGYRVEVVGGPTTPLLSPSQHSRTIAGLTNGVSYTFRVFAVNADGTSVPSAPSNAVTPRPRAGQWANAAPMGTARIHPLAVTLTNGRVLVVGGSDNAGNPIATAELYNPATNTWSPAGVPGARAAATLTRLGDGRVLLVGGLSAGGSALATTRVYRPATNTWANAGVLGVGRANAAAVLLSTGKVLIAGGLTGGPGGYAVTASAELFTPGPDSWAVTGPLGQARQGHSLDLINGGMQALAAGGSAGSAGFTSAERYRTGTGTWAPTGPMTMVREFDDKCCKTSVTLADGRVLVAGGYRNPPGPLRTAEAFRPPTGTWAATPLMGVAREAGHTAVRLADGTVLVVGGQDDFGALAANDLYRPASNSWVRPDDLRVPRSFPAAVRLNNGRVLVTGGYNAVGVAQAGTEIFTP